MEYNRGMGQIKFTASAARHGITEEQARYIMANSFDNGRFIDRAGRPAVWFKGTLHAQTDRVAEVFVTIDHGTFIVFHAMETGERHP